MEFLSEGRLSNASVMMMMRGVLLVTLPFLFLLDINNCSSGQETPRIRHPLEPYFYKTLHMGRPVTFPTPKPSPMMLQKKKKMMMLGCAKEDRQVEVTSFPSISPVANLIDPTALEVTGNAIDNMVDTAVMTKGNQAMADPLVKNLMNISNEVDSIGQVSTRTSSASSSSMNETAKAFQNRVRELLAFSGVELVLPLECGRNPLNPDEPLGRDPLPWIAALGSRQNGRFHYRCVGVVISDSHILTDGDCVASPEINVVQLNVTGFVPEPFAVENFVVGRRLHPEIKDEQDLLGGKNIGLLELAFPLKFNNYVQPICLPGVFDEPDHDDVSRSTLIGFDNINDTPTGRTASIYTWSNSKTLGSAACYTAIRRFNRDFPDRESTLFNLLTKNHVCVDRPFEEVGKSVVVKEDLQTGRVGLIGVSGIANAQTTNPIAYSLVQPHRFWIELVIKTFNDNKAAGRS